MSAAFSGVLEVMPMDWTPKVIAKMTRMWSDGVPVSEICEAVGAPSRDAVIGKAHRLELPEHPHSVARRDKARAREVLDAKTPSKAKQKSRAKVAAPRPKADGRRRKIMLEAHKATVAVKSAKNARKKLEKATKRASSPGVAGDRSNDVSAILVAEIHVEALFEQAVVSMAAVEVASVNVPAMELSAPLPDPVVEEIAAPVAIAMVVEAIPSQPLLSAEPSVDEIASIAVMGESSLVEGAGEVETPPDAAPLRVRLKNVQRDLMTARPARRVKRPQQFATPVEAPEATDAFEYSHLLALNWKGAALALDGLNESRCKWPVGDPKNAAFAYCGDTRDGKSVYCSFHRFKAYQAPASRRAGASAA